MAQKIEKYISTDVSENKNRHWTIILEDNGDVVTKWARVGDSEQSKTFPNAGQKFFDRKIREKIKKGYHKIEIVGESTSPEKSISGKSIVDLAINQISKNDPNIEALIKFLAESNIHNITSNTTITYNKNTGLFSTPLGVVCQDNINKARKLLVEIVDNKKVEDRAQRKENFDRYVSEYLMLVPQKVGRVLDSSALFPNIESVLKQNDILDSLQSSLDFICANPSKVDGNKQANEQKVFDVSINLVDSNELERIDRKYQSTRKSIHASSSLKVSKAYKIEVGFIKNRFLDGEKMELWHGTSYKNILSILKSGLRICPPDSVSIAGKNFGNGIYFAIDSTKSLNYSQGYWSGSRNDRCFMFLANVNLGKYFTPKNTTRDNPPTGYDSYWAKSGNSGRLIHDEIVVFDERRYDLTYLVEFSS